MPRRSSRSDDPDLFASATTPALPDGLVYETDFLAVEEEAELLATIATLPFHEARYREYTAKRRTVSYGASYDFSTNEPLPAPPVPAWLFPLRERVAAWTAIPSDDFGFALVTEYQPGTQLGWHRDVPNFETVVGVSLAGQARMRFRPWPATAPPRRAAFHLDLQPRSVYVLRGDARWRWQHAISPTKALRYSITFRTARSLSGTAPRLR
jgi:alkylated DNA repair dioxygenase AlkB